MGAFAYKQLPVSALPQVDYPDHSGHHSLPWGQSGCNGVAGDCAARRSSSRPGSGLESNDVHQFVSRVASVVTPAVPSRSEHRCRRAAGAERAINAAASFLPRDLPNPPVYSKTNPADSPILTLALTSKTLELPKIEADFGGYAAGAEDFSASRRRAGQHFGWAEAGGADSGQSDGAVLLQAKPGRSANGNCRHKR